MKTNLFLSICFIGLAVSLSSQAYSFKKPKGSYGWVLGMSMGTRTLDYNDIETITDDPANQIAYPEASLGQIRSFRLGFDYSKFLVGKTFFRTGLRVNSPAYNTFHLPTLDPELSKKYDTERTNSELRYRFRLREYKLEIPLVLRYHFMSDICAVFVEGGISTNIYLMSTVKKEVEHSSLEIVPVRSDRLNFQGLISIGSEWDLTDNLPMFVQMVIRYSPMQHQVGLTEARDFSCGVEFGTRKYF